MTIDEKIVLCEKYKISLGKEYSSYDLDPEITATLVAGNLEGDFLLRHFESNWEWVGSFESFLHSWDIV